MTYSIYDFEVPKTLRVPPVTAMSGHSLIPLSISIVHDSPDPHDTETILDTMRVFLRGRTFEYDPDHSTVEAPFRAIRLDPKDWNNPEASTHIGPTIHPDLQTWIRSCISAILPPKKS